MEEIGLLHCVPVSKLLFGALALASQILSLINFISLMTLLFRHQTTEGGWWRAVRHEARQRPLLFAFYGLAVGSIVPIHVSPVLLLSSGRLSNPDDLDPVLMIQFILVYFSYLNVVYRAAVLPLTEVRLSEER